MLPLSTILFHQAVTAAEQNDIKTALVSHPQ